MKAWWTKLWDTLRASFWFLPAVMTVAGVVLSFVMIGLDVQLDVVDGVPSWISTAPPAARTTLSALGGALLTGMSVVFSITMLVRAQASSQFGPRLLRTIGEGNVSQITAGTFLGTSVYCLMVLRTVREGEAAFVPHLSVTVAVGLAVAALCVLIAFLQNVSSTIQAQSVVRSVYHDLDDAIERLYPDEVGEDADAEEARLPPAVDRGREARRVHGERTGYVQAVDVATLTSLAAEHDLVIEVKPAPGSFVAPSTIVAEVVPARHVDDDVAREIAGCVLTGSRRTPRQDVECPIRELVEVAVRALSPGVNDPFTAESCIDYLGAALTKLAGRPVPSPYRRDETGNVRVVVPPVTFARAVATALDAIRHYGRDSAGVTFRLLEAVQAVAGHVVRPGDLPALRRQVDLVERASKSEFAASIDENEVRRVLRETRDRLARREGELTGGASS